MVAELVRASAYQLKGRGFESGSRRSFSWINSRLIAGSSDKNATSPSDDVIYKIAKYMTSWTVHLSKPGPIDFRSRVPSIWSRVPSIHIDWNLSLQWGDGKQRGDGKHREEMESIEEIDKVEKTRHLIHWKNLFYLFYPGHPLFQGGSHVLLTNL